MPAYTNSRIAAGTINPFVFIQKNPGANPYYPELTCLQCTGGEIIGIGAEWTNAPFGLANQPAGGPPAATLGQAIRVFGDGEETIIMVGSGYNVMQDELLVSDGSGNAIPYSPTNTAAVQWIGARAIESGIAGDVIRVSVVLRPYLGVA